MVRTELYFGKQLYTQEYTPSRISECHWTLEHTYEMRFGKRSNMVAMFAGQSKGAGSAGVQEIMTITAACS